MCSVLRKEGKNYYCLEGFLLSRILVEKYWLYRATDSFTCYVSFQGFVWLGWGVALLGHYNI